jgi:hypothetical protein
MRVIRLASLAVFAVALALMSVQAFAWQKGYPFPTDLSIPLDDHHSVLVWFQNTPEIHLDFTKHSTLHGDQSSDEFPVIACVTSEATDSSTSSLLVEEAVLNLPLPADVKADLKISSATRLVLKLEIDTNFPAQQSAHAAELDAVDNSGVVTQVLFQGTLPFDANGPIAEISLGKEGQYLSNPALTCK